MTPELDSTSWMASALKLEGGAAHFGVSGVNAVH
jgi:hypothetical protein